MKEIKDYLHLYLGCEVQVEIYGQMRIVKFVGINDDYYFLHNSDDSDGIRYFKQKYPIKPILRPLSDIKEEEAKELGILLYTGVIVGEPYKTDKFWIVPYGLTLTDYWEIDGKVFNQHQTIYLLSKHFDLFGLIEAGLAFDKTKIKNEYKRN